MGWIQKLVQRVAQLRRNPIGNAYSYAVGAEELDRYPHHWENLRLILNAGVTRAFALIPVVGYVILFSDYFRSLFTFSTLSQGKGFLTFDQRLYLAYYGGLGLFSAYVVYFVASPRLIRPKRDVHQFIADVVNARDDSTLYRVYSALHRYLWSLPLDTDSRNQKHRRLIGARNNVTRDQQPRNVEAGDYAGLGQQMLSFYYHWQNFSHPNVRLFVFSLAILSWSLISIPALDLCIRVVRHTLGI